MVDIKKLVNVKILASYQSVFDDGLTIEALMEKQVDVADLCLLSAISFYEGEERLFNEWARKSIKSFPNGFAIFGRSERLQVWKYLLSNLNGKTALSNDERLLNLTKLFMLINDKDNSNCSVRHQFSLGFLNNYRDRYISQCYRSKNIFLSEGFLNNYGYVFERNCNVKVHEYSYVVHSIIGYYMTCKNRMEYSNSYEPLSWILNVGEMASHLNIDRGNYDKVLRLISFDLSEGESFSVETLGDVNNFSLFRNRPFLKISQDLYIPIDGKMTEDLQFNNLFYRFKDMSDQRYMIDFGVYFEEYVRSVTELSVSSSEIHKYTIIPEFEYKKGQCRSPDLILLTNNENSALVIEVKSARVLAQVTDSNNDEDSLIQSLVKLKEKPWEQAAKSISEIKRLKINPEINANKVYYFLSVTMNDIPMSLIDFEITNDKGAVLTELFFSMNIEAYECLLEIISSNSKINVFDILRSYRKFKDRMSMKTYLSKMKKAMNIESNPLIDHMNAYQFECLLFLRSLENHK